MSAYCTINDITGEIQNADLVRCTDDGKTGSVDMGVLNQVIANASSIIDQYLGAVYNVPFTVVPPSVLPLAVTITCYHLFRRRLVPGEENKFYEDYKRVVRQLEKYQDRTLTLDLSVTQDFAQVQYDARPTIYGFGGPYNNTM